MKASRALIIGIIIVIVLVMIFLRGDQITELAEAIKQGSIGFIIAAVLAQLGKYTAQSFAYKFAFAATGEKMRVRETLPLVFGTFFVNTLAPSMNLAGTSLVVDSARRKGIPVGKGTSAALLMQITIDSGFAIIMLVTFSVLTLTVGLDPVWFSLGLIVVALVSAMVLIMIMGWKLPKVAKAVFGFIERLVNAVLRLFKRKETEPWADKTVESFGEAASLIFTSPKITAKAFGCSIIASCCELATFVLVGVGFNVTAPVVLVCGYVVATLFAMISPVPQGVGVVEAAVTAAFAMFGQSATAGVAIVLVYRSIVFWLPFLVGAVMINATGSFSQKATNTDSVEAIEPASEELVIAEVSQKTEKSATD